MDLSNLNIPDTVTVHLEFPTIGKLYNDDDKTQPVTIELYSPASEPVIAYSKKVQLDAARKFNKRNKATTLTPEEIEERSVERLCAFTASVNNLTYEGDLITKDTVDKVYADPKMGWLCDQLSEKLGSWDDFLG